GPDTAHGTSATGHQPLIAHWDGTSWAVVSSPNTSVMHDTVLRAVTCVSASDCWAVGDYYNGTVSTPFQTLIEHWDGTSWAIVTSPDTSATTDNVLYGVTCVSASDCWAVGEYGLIGSVTQTLIAR